MEPPHSYVQDTSASVVHHGDYLNRDDRRALCGLALTSATMLGDAAGDGAICPDCEAKLAQYHAAWWRERALAVEAELEELRHKYRQLTGDAEEAQKPSPEATQTTASPTTEEEPASLLGRARVELAGLCRQCDGVVPYWRLKTTMQAFSDKLSPDERVLLAQEIGADGSLIRWCTTEIDNLGWQVTNSPVQEESEAMWDAWTHDAYQTPKKNKWRLGRSRSRDAS
ncbi:hypothetical protein [Mycobacterium sp. GA-1199]|uniref:hypothetical protein n=1 Tax=Mycobacterium sp. GA-1199 TaxID=1772287 RepID=UPI000AC4588F|nr:hypothetical protein [Mycobacterium sp. GA-1199]